jgi:hypothetical protein
MCIVYYSSKKMSFTRQSYDQCAYNKNLRQSVSVLDHLLDPNKYYNVNEGRVELGVFGGTNVSLSKDNLVNIESDLRGQTRQLSTCPELKYLPSCEGCDTNEGIPCGSWSCRQKEDLVDLKPVDIMQLGPRPTSSGFDLRYTGCPVENLESIDGSRMRNQPYFNPVVFQAPR